jgi:enterochelin esterase-like enzyme
MAVFLLIGKTSALTMNIAGVAKDWMLIGLSVALFHSAVSHLNLFGYVIAFAAVCWYNFRKLQAAKAGAVAPSTPTAGAQPEERIPLKVMDSSLLASKQQK